MALIAFSTSLEIFHLAEAISFSYFDRLLVQAPPSQFKYQLLNSKQSILSSDGWISVAEKSSDNEKDEQLLKSTGGSLLKLSTIYYSISNGSLHKATCSYT